MPKHDLIEAEIKWCEEHRNPEEQVYQDGFIAGLRHALFIMKSRPTLRAAVNQDTTDALHASVQHLFNLGYINNYGCLDEVERILRDRLGCG